MSARFMVLGAGGHARVLIDTLLTNECDVIGATDSESAKHGTSIRGVPVLGNDDILVNYSPESVVVVNGIGSVASMGLRRSVFDKYKKLGYHFATVVHPSAVIAKDVLLGEGAQIMAGAIIQPGVSIGANTIVNTGASIDHDCQIGAHVHIAPGVVLSGEVNVKDNTHLGTGSVLIQKIVVGENCVIGAGSVVVRDVAPGKRILGVPAKEI